MQPRPKPAPFRRQKRNNAGFTLLEVLIAIVLTAAVTLIGAMALRLAVQAGERTGAEGESRQVVTALTALLRRQLAGYMPLPGQAAGLSGSTGMPMTGAGVKSISAESISETNFCGAETELTFFTSHALQGSNLQGMQRVTYIYNEETRTLTIHDQIVTRRDDLDETLDPFSENFYETILPVSTIEDVDAFYLTYANEEYPDPGDPDYWEPEWPCDGAMTELGMEVPVMVALELAVGTGKGRISGKWLFPVGRP
ncbi:MAG: type II secretion system protein J [Desulfatirhabdiaceae bacterium]